jgi:hypothetical protein
VALLLTTCTEASSRSMPTADSLRGRGLAIVEAVSDRLDIASTDRRVTVTAGWRCEPPVT